MAYGNPYMNNPYGSMYGSSYGYAPQQSYSVPQQPQMPTQSQQPRTNIQFFTEEEIKAYVLMPNTQMMAIDKEKPCFYIKTADAAGRSTLNIFEYKSVTESNAPADATEFAKKSDLAEYATKQDIAELRSLIEKKDMRGDSGNE